MEKISSKTKTKSEVTTYFERRKGYFQDWETIKYRLNITDKDGKIISSNEEYEIVNFLHRFHFRSSIVNDISLYSYWEIRTHETLFSISNTLYGSPYYFWIIILLNDMVDPFWSWPMSEEQLLLFCQQKYGRDNIYKTHHYESSTSGDLYSFPKGMIVTPPPIDKDLDADLVKRIKEKYKTDDPDDVRESVYELLPAYADGLTKPYAYGYTSVSNYDYETKENEKRRKIKLMKPQYLNDVEREKEDIVKANFIHINRSLVRFK